MKKISFYISAAIVAMSMSSCSLDSVSMKEADTLTLAGEIFYDIKYLFKREKERSYIYAINDSPDGVLFCDKSIRFKKVLG